MNKVDQSGAIEAFTNQVRVICLKNDINKQTLGQRLGLDSDVVFSQIKNKSFKPDVSVYFKLEKEICGRDGISKNKLRSKYEKTLSSTEMDDYIRYLHRPVAKTSIKKVGDILPVVKKEETKKPRKTYQIDIESRKEFGAIVKELLAKKHLSLNAMDAELFGGKSTIKEVVRGRMFIPVDRLKDMFEYCGVEKGSDVYLKLLDLEIACIAGPREDRELAKYEKIFGQKEESMTQEELKTVIVDDKGKSRREFAAMLTKYLFVNGYTFEKAATAIGCSSSELKAVIEGLSCLSPYHVNRFKQTLQMDDQMVGKLVELSGKAYERHEVPEKVLDYIGSDQYIIDVIEKAVSKHLPASKWKCLEEAINSACKWQERSRS